MSNYEILIGDCIEQMQTLPDNSVHCIVTSPPYFALRDYQTGTWEGGDNPDCDHKIPKHEGDPKRGSLYKDKGSSHDIRYNRDSCHQCGAKRVDKQGGLEKELDCLAWARGEEPCSDCYICWIRKVAAECHRVLRDDGTLWWNVGDSYNGSGGAGGDYAEGGLKEGQPKYGPKRLKSLKPKDMCMTPARTALALQADGWWLRQDIIWAKKNCMPEPVKDRCTKNHEYIYLLAKSQHYSYDSHAIEEKGKEGGKRNKRSVWNVNTRPYKGAHFAVYPPELIEPCILAGCPPDGTVLDPFLGSGTTIEVALKHGRNAIGIELNPEYAALARKRLAKVDKTLAINDEREWL